MYGFDKDHIPESYQKIGWEERLERTSRDYGLPEKPYQSPFPFTDYERSEEFLSATEF